MMEGSKVDFPRPKIDPKPKIAPRLSRRKPGPVTNDVRIVNLFIEKDKSHVVQLVKKTINEVSPGTYNKDIEAYILEHRFPLYLTFSQVLKTREDYIAYFQALNSASDNTIQQDAKIAMVMANYFEKHLEAIKDSIERQ